MNIPTTLPFFNGTRKQATRRDSSPCVIYSPRTQLPPFQIQRPHVANDWVKDIFLVDCDDNEYDLQKYFEDSIELLIGGYTNGADALQAMDTLTQESATITGGPTWWIDEAEKTTTGAGVAGYASTETFAVTEDELLYLEINLTLTSGIAPKVMIADGGDAAVSNTVLLVAGENNIIFTITDTEATAVLLFYNASADATNYSFTAILTRTARPVVTELTSVDYIEYYGDPLIWTGNLVEEVGSFGTFAFDTFATGVGVSIATAIEVAGTATAKGLLDLDSVAIAGDKYVVHIENVSKNSGQTPTYNVTNSDEGAQALADGNNTYTFTIKSSPTGAATLVIQTTDATDFVTGQISVYKLSGTHDADVPLGLGLLPKGAFYLKLTDGTNEWYSEWFEIRDIYENLHTSISGSTTYETLITSGTKLISVIETGSAGALFGASSFSVANDEVITVVFFGVQNSGQAPSITLTDESGGDVISNTGTMAGGINEISLIATKAISDARIRFNNSAASNFSTSEIWVRRKYASDFVKLEFTNDKDLRGKRSDDQTIIYQNDFTQECWLNTVLNTPAQNRVDVGSEKDGVFIPEKIVTQQKYKIVDYINRSLFEGLIRLPQHDTITITDEVGNSYTPDQGNVETSEEWTTFDTCTFTLEFNDGSFVWTPNSTDLT